MTLSLQHWKNIYKSFFKSEQISVATKKCFVQYAGPSYAETELNILKAHLNYFLAWGILRLGIEIEFHPT